MPTKYKKIKNNSSNQRNIITMDNDFRQNSDCLICLSEIDNESIIYTKNNIFNRIDNDKICVTQCNCCILVHKSCMEKWLTINCTCPICLTSMKQMSLVEYYRQIESHRGLCIEYCKLVCRGVLITGCFCIILCFYMPVFGRQLEIFLAKFILLP